MVLPSSQSIGRWLISSMVRLLHRLTTNNWQYTCTHSPPPLYQWRRLDCTYIIIPYRWDNIDHFCTSVQYELHCFRGRWPRVSRDDWHCGASANGIRSWWRQQIETFSALLALCVGNSPVTGEGQWRGALMFSLICARINGWVNNREAGDSRRHCTHYDVIVMNFGHTSLWPPSKFGGTGRQALRRIKMWGEGRYPPAVAGFPSNRASNAGLWCFID